MLIDYEVQRCTRHCASSGRELLEGEAFYSVLLPRGAALERLDYATEAWNGPPADALGWWKSQMPTRESRKAQLAPSDVLLEFFVGLADQPEQADMRYVLALLLIRRRIARLEETQTDADSRETLVLYCHRDESMHRVAVVLPDERREAEIQTELSRLLYAQPARG
jgi:hypothetical protein